MNKFLSGMAVALLVVLIGIKFMVWRGYTFDIYRVTEAPPGDGIKIYKMHSVFDED